MSRLLQLLTYPTYTYFALKSRVQVRWMRHPRSCLYHATHDGKESLCGVKTLVDEDPRWASLDPSDDLMTCLHCQGMVRRVASIS